MFLFELGHCKRTHSPGSTRRTEALKHLDDAEEFIASLTPKCSQNPSSLSSSSAAAAVMPLPRTFPHRDEEFDGPNSSLTAASFRDLVIQKMRELVIEHLFVLSALSVISFVLVCSY